MDQRAQGNVKKISSLDDKLKSYMKNQALMGGGNYGGGNIVEEIEESITKLRDDLKDLKKMSESELTIIRNDLTRKSTKEDGLQLEERMTSTME